MKLIFSRKGFDSSSGGKPSPIFPDGIMLSLPIPDKASTIRYSDIMGNPQASVGELVRDLAHIPPTYGAHLDPDLSASSVPRKRGWRPLFGQVNAAQKHLENNEVGAGDVFLFFGLFRRVERSASRWRFVPGCDPVHICFGWLQVAERVPVLSWPKHKDWAFYHPHFRREQDLTNVLYVATCKLELPGFGTSAIPGAGTFPRHTSRLQLTAPQCKTPSLWLLPEWFHPRGRDSALTFHNDPARWQASKSGLLLATVARGQEFVLDCADYPEAVHWLHGLLSTALA